MDLPDNNYILIILGVVAIIIEVMVGVATGFDLLLIGLIFILSGGLGILTGSFQYALIGVAVLSILYVFVGRRLIKSKLSVATTKTNTEQLVGSTGIVTKKILADKPGQIKVDGEIWRARAKETISEGVEVLIESVSGVTLAVKKN